MLWLELELDLKVLEATPGQDLALDPHCLASEQKFSHHLWMIMGLGY